MMTLFATHWIIRIYIKRYTCILVIKDRIHFNDRWRGYIDELSILMYMYVVYVQN